MKIGLRFLSTKTYVLFLEINKPILVRDIKITDNSFYSFKERRLFQLKPSHERKEINKLLQEIKSTKLEENKAPEAKIFNSLFDKMLHKMKTKA